MPGGCAFVGGAGVAVAALLAPVAHLEHEALPAPRTLVTLGGAVEAFAQDGPRIAWLAVTVADDGASCRRVLRVRMLTRRAPTTTTRVPNGCGEIENGVRLALAGRSAVWRRVADVGNLELHADVWTAVAGAPRARRLQRLHTTRDLDAGEDHATLPVAGSGGTLVYDAEDDYRSPPFRSIRRVVVGRSRHVFAFDRALALAVDGRRIAAVGRAAPGTPTARGEIRTTGGTLVSTFSVRGDPLDVALRGEVVALLALADGAMVVSALDARTGVSLRKLALPLSARPALGGVVGRSVVFQRRHRIERVDVDTGSTTVLAIAAADPLDLSVSGRRVAWAENLPGTAVHPAGVARVRAVSLP